MLVFLLSLGVDVVEGGLMVFVLFFIMLLFIGNFGSFLFILVVGGVLMGVGLSCMREMSVFWEFWCLIGGVLRFMVVGGLGERGVEDGDDEFDVCLRCFWIDLLVIGEVIVG